MDTEDTEQSEGSTHAISTPGSNGGGGEANATLTTPVKALIIIVAALMLGMGVMGVCVMRGRCRRGVGSTRLISSADDAMGAFGGRAAKGYECPTRMLSVTGVKRGARKVEHADDDDLLPADSAAVEVEVEPHPRDGGARNGHAHHEDGESNNTEQLFHL